MFESPRRRGIPRRQRLVVVVVPLARCKRDEKDGFRIPFPLGRQDMVSFVLCTEDRYCIVAESHQIAGKHIVHQHTNQRPRAHEVWHAYSTCQDKTQLQYNTIIWNEFPASRIPQQAAPNWPAPMAECRVKSIIIIAIMVFFLPPPCPHHTWYLHVFSFSCSSGGGGCD